jgi:hypothetical protein
MSKMRILLPLVVATLSFCGCESFQRFEAWKRETFLGEPPAQGGPPTYPMYGYQQPAPPVLAPAPVPRVQPAAMPVYTGQPAKAPGPPPMAQPVSQPIILQTSG